MTFILFSLHFYCLVRSICLSGDLQLSIGHCYRFSDNLFLVLSSSKTKETTGTGAALLSVSPRWSLYG